MRAILVVAGVILAACSGLVQGSRTAAKADDQGSLPAEQVEVTIGATGLSASVWDLDLGRSDGPIAKFSRCEDTSNSYSPSLEFTCTAEGQKLWITDTDGTYTALYDRGGDHWEYSFACGPGPEQTVQGKETTQLLCQIQSRVGMAIPHPVIGVSNN